MQENLGSESCSIMLQNDDLYGVLHIHLPSSKRDDFYRWQSYIASANIMSKAQGDIGGAAVSTCVVVRCVQRYICFRNTKYQTGKDPR
jgi:hypothetical protein